MVYNEKQMQETVSIIQSKLNKKENVRKKQKLLKIN